VNYYPVFLDLKGKKAVVVGGGRVAERKIASLVRAGALVTVISPTLTKSLLRLKSGQKIRHRARQFKKDDLKGAFVVVSATDSPSTNRKVSAGAPALVNVVDVPSECNFIVPSVVKRDPLVIAVSTGGASPGLSKAIRKELERSYGREFSEYLKFLKKIRAKALIGITQKKKREIFLKGLASQKIFDMLREKGVHAVKKIVTERLEKAAK
jgi:precorrin-2 dehydrogenase/sirohydrochlorin ferrochelatase